MVGNGGEFYTLQGGDAREKGERAEIRRGAKCMSHLVHERHESKSARTGKQLLWRTELGICCAKSNEGFDL